MLLGEAANLKPIIKKKDEFFAPQDERESDE